MKSPVVHILVSVNDPAHFDACTLCFDTLRVGWPTAEITVDVNFPTAIELRDRIAAKLDAAGAGINRRWLYPRVHHADWIHDCVKNHNPTRPLVICDPDTIFWKSCEDWNFPADTLLAGYYVPEMWNDFAKCVSFSRIHTSMMVFPHVPALRTVIRAKYPWSHEKYGEYCPCDPFMPAVRFIHGRPYFWDSCANLYSMLADVAPLTYALEPEHLECFDHLNSASFHDVMRERMDDPRGFALAHDEWVKRPELLRNLWPIVNRYYKQKALEAEIRKP